MLNLIHHLFPKQHDQDSAAIARKRLVTVILQEKNDSQHSVDTRLLQRDLLRVLAQYYEEIDPDQVEVAHEDGYSVFKIAVRDDHNASISDDC